MKDTLTEITYEAVQIFQFPPGSNQGTNLDRGIWTLPVVEKMVDVLPRNGCCSAILGREMRKFAIISLDGKDTYFDIRDGDAVQTISLHGSISVNTSKVWLRTKEK